LALNYVLRQLNHGLNHKMVATKKLICKIRSYMKSRSSVEMLLCRICQEGKFSLELLPDYFLCKNLVKRKVFVKRYDVQANWKQTEHGTRMARCLVWTLTLTLKKIWS